MRRIILFVFVVLILVACASKGKSTFAYNGHLDAEVIRLTSQVNGTIDSVRVDEGDRIKQGQLLIKIDDKRIRLKLRQQQAQLEEIQTNLEALNAKMRQVESRLQFNKQTLQKTEVMLKQGAATPQQRDQLATQVCVLKAQLDELRIKRKLFFSKNKQLQAGIAITQLALNDCRILAPINGVVINRLVQPGELAVQGKNLIEVADLTHLKVTIYVPLTRLNRIKLGQKAIVKIDGSNEKFPAILEWISSEAEFTPKTIMTEETRTTLVYAVKLKVNNSVGKLKIGMPVEVYLQE